MSASEHASLDQLVDRLERAAEQLRSGDLFISLTQDRTSAVVYAVAAQDRLFAGLPRRE